MFFKKKFTVQQKIDSVKRVEERQYETPQETGLMSDYLRCIDTSADKWEVAFVMHFTDKLFEIMKSSSVNSAINVTMTYRSFDYNDCLIPILFIQLNNNEKLSFACMLRLDVFKEKGHPMSEVNILKILNEQQKINFSLAMNGKKMPSIYVTNQIRGYLSKDVDRLDREKLDEKTWSRYSLSHTNLIFQAHMENMNADFNMGSFLWNKLIK